MDHGPRTPGITGRDQFEQRDARVSMMTKTQGPVPQQGSTPAPKPQQQGQTAPEAPQQGHPPIFKDWASI